MQAEYNQYTQYHVKMNLFIQYFSKNMLNKPENEGTQALHTLLTYKY